MIPMMLVSLAFGAGNDETEKSERKSYQINILLKVGDPLGSRDEGNVKHLCNPTMGTFEGSSCAVVCNGKEEIGRAHV